MDGCGQVDGNNSENARVGGGLGGNNVLIDRYVKTFKPFKIGNMYVYMYINRYFKCLRPPFEITKLRPC